MTARAAAGGLGRREEGFSLAAAMATIAIMTIMMGAAVPSWQYVMRNMREEELIFRGIQIAEAVERYQRKNGGAAPTSLEVLVKGKFLRKNWGDPMKQDGKWRLIRPGEGGGPRFGRRPRRDRRGGASDGTGAGDRQGSQGPGGGLGAGDRPGALGAGGGLGGFVGVATTFEGEAFRIFNGQTKYEEWFFVAGQPRVVGRLGKAGAALPGALPGMEMGPGRRNNVIRDRPSGEQPK
jgi:type II secretory pathway pseudopilin PulG